MFKKSKASKASASHNSRGLEQIETRVPGGQSIRLSAYYEEFLAYYPECELQTKQWFCENIGKDFVCIDAGANIGYHSVLMARLAESGKIYAFEPTNTYDMLLTNLQANCVTNVIPLRQALGDRTFIGEEKIFRRWGYEAERTVAEFIRLDDFVDHWNIGRLDLVKIDVDGFDLEVLWGAVETLEKFRPIVVVELNHALMTRGYTPSQAIDWLVRNGYGTAHILDGDNWVFLPGGEGVSLSVSVETGDPHLLLQQPFFGRELPLDISAAQICSGAASPSERLFTSLEPRWSYVAIFDIPPAVCSIKAVRVRGTVTSGDLGVFVSDNESSTIIGHEYKFDSSQSAFDFFLPVLDGQAEKVVFRKTSGRELRFSLDQILLVLDA